MNILIIGYCHLADGFLYASKALQNLNYKIYFFPYLSYKMDKNDNLIDDFKKIIKNDNINICLWWNNSIEFNEFDKMYSKSIKNIFYNWDPFLFEGKKYNTDNWNKRLDKKTKIYDKMDLIFSCFEKEIDYFKNTNKIYYNPPGFDESASFYEYEKDYICDISIVLTNLYEDNQEFPKDATNISRYEIVNTLYEHRDKINFHIYGPENLKNKYPDCYKKFIKYDDCRKVFSNSKINLSIHPIINELSNKKSNMEYFSERVPQILGSKGLLMTNSQLSYILKKDIDYIQINKENCLDEIKNILNNNNKYNYIRQNGYEKVLKYYKWDKWAEIINNTLNNN